MNNFGVAFRRGLISTIAKLLNTLKYALGKKLIKNNFTSLILKVRATFSDETDVNFIYEM